VYIAQQMQAHKEALMLAEEYARKGDDLDLRRFAERSVREIQMRLDRISAIALREREREIARGEIRCGSPPPDPPPQGEVGNLIADACGEDSFAAQTRRGWVGGSSPPMVSDF